MEDEDGQMKYNAYTVGPKKLHHFIFAITLSKRFTVKKLLANTYSNKSGTIRHKKHHSLAA